MSFTVIDPAQFIPDGMFRQEEFLDALRKHDWGQYRGAKTLVRGCGDIVTPPWAFMAITGYLAGVAKSIRYGNEHDNVVVFRERTKSERT